MNIQVVEMYEKYKEWVILNPLAASDVEATVKWISIYLAARFKNTKVITELVYSLSNLLVLFNDRILTNSLNASSDSTTIAGKIKLWLTVLEYVEVFIEVTARESWKDRGMWSVAAFIQMIKCIGRIMLVVKYKESIVQIPPVPPLRRKDMQKQTSSQTTKIGFRLPSSGRIVRSVDGVDTKGMRTWKPPTLCEVYANGTAPDAKLNTNQTIAEIVYILKPLVHLCAVMKCGPRTWRPYFVSLILDLFSLQLFRENKTDRNKLSFRQKSELSRRQIALLLYILRSPFYERFSSKPINSLAHGLSSNLPLVGIILRPLAEYLPTWQDTYFYMWSA